MFDRLMALFQRPAVLLALLLIFQALLYWTMVIYMGSESVPVAYQRF